LAPRLTVGVIEGIAEATASIVKIFSGALSDRLGKRKLLAAAGYGLAAFTKPIFPLAASVGWSIAARFIDRVGKGIRGAPRCPDRRSHTTGAAWGQLRPAAIARHRRRARASGRHRADAAARQQFHRSVPDRRNPAFLSFAVIAFAVRDPDRPAAAVPVRSPLSTAELSRLGAPYWLIVAVATMFTLARFSEAFCSLRAIRSA
jgi:hypothetical protein